MIIKKLILSGYKRLFLNNIELLEFTPESIVNIILGANGSGKSSLLYMLNPLPADLKKEFKENGYKSIEIEHRNKFYVLSSGKVHPNKHSFIVDDIEYNEGGTRKVQLDLVYQHFNITNDINNVLLGLTNFTNMSSIDRKHWFSMLSTVDYSYAIKVYNALRQRHRDVVGGIKLDNEQLLKLEANIVTDNELAKLIDDSKILEEYIEHVLSLYDHKRQAISNIDYTETLNELNKSIKTLYSKIITPTLSIEQIESSITKLSTARETYSNDLKTINEKIHKLEDSYADVTDINKSLESKKEHELAIAEIRKYNMYNLDLDNIEPIVHSYTMILPRVLDILNELSDYSSYIVIKEQYNDNVKKLQSMKQLMDVRSKELVIISAERDTMLKHKHEDNTVTCEKCSHSWYLGYDDVKYSGLCNEVDKRDSDLLKINKSYSELEVLVSNEKNKLHLIDTIYTIVKDAPYISEVLTDILIHNPLTKVSPTVVTDKLNKLTGMLEYCLSYVKHKESVTKIDQSITVLKEISNGNDKAIEVMIKDYEKDLSDITIKLTSIQNSLTKYETELQYKKTLKTLREKIITTLRTYRKSVNYDISNERNRSLTELVNILKTELIHINQTISLSRQRLNELEGVKNRLSTYKTMDKVLGLLVKEISPSEGIIAKSMNSFLNVFINEMNTIINSVWSYNMTLLPCEVTEDNDLDYKFKVKVNDDSVIEDISKLSSSMQEIVNLAFKIVFVKYLKISDTPLMLDEFGRTMDPTHRVNAYNVIDRILASNFSQIYIVSHFESMYGRFANSDISVIDPKNLDLNPSIRYNKVLKINNL